MLNHPRSFTARVSVVTPPLLAPLLVLVREIPGSRQPSPPLQTQFSSDCPPQRSAACGLCCPRRRSPAPRCRRAALLPAALSAGSAGRGRSRAGRGGSAAHGDALSAPGGEASARGRPRAGLPTRAFPWRGAPHRAAPLGPAAVPRGLTAVSERAGLHFATVQHPQPQQSPATAPPRNRSDGRGRRERDSPPPPPDAGARAGRSPQRSWRSALSAGRQPAGRQEVPAQRLFPAR